MKKERRPTSEEVQPVRGGEFVQPLGSDKPPKESQVHKSLLKHHELELLKLEGMRVEVLTMTRAQAAQLIDLLASIGLELWGPDETVLQKDVDGKNEAA
jgi:hypothetical protein